jgi:hypothetical protein
MWPLDLGFPRHQKSEKEICFLYKLPSLWHSVTEGENRLGYHPKVRDKTKHWSWSWHFVGGLTSRCVERGAVGQLELWSR